MKEVIYFELNNWMRGKNYPNAEPFISWFKGFGSTLNNEKWAKENKLCIVSTPIDMSMNYCITASKEWVEKNCPELLTKYKSFQRFPDKDGYVYGKNGNEDEFNEWLPEFFGIEEHEEDNGYY